MYLRYALYAPLSLLFNMFVMLTSPIWAAWVAVTRAAHLPGPFRYLYTDDDDIYGSRMTKEPVPPTAWGRFKRAVWWLCRNPGFGFARSFLGMPVNAYTKITWVTDTTPNPLGDWDSGQANTEHFVAENPDGVKWFNYRRDFPTIPGRYAKLWLGWQHDGRIKIMFNPFLTSRGKQ